LGQRQPGFIRPARGLPIFRSHYDFYSENKDHNITAPIHYYYFLNKGCFLLILRKYEWIITTSLFPGSYVINTDGLLIWTPSGYLSGEGKLATLAITDVQASLIVLYYEDKGGYTTADHPDLFW
jgi:hypothetical protein